MIVNKRVLEKTYEEAVCGKAQPARNLSDGITAFRYLTDGSSLQFRCKSWCAITLLLCASYNAESSTGAGVVSESLRDFSEFAWKF